MTRSFVDRGMKSSGEHPCIVHVSTADHLGGAEGVAWALFSALKVGGNPTWLTVGRKTSSDPDVVRISNDAHRSPWGRCWIRAARAISRIEGLVPGASIGRMLCLTVAEPARFARIRWGYEDFEFPGSQHLLKLTPRLPDLVHCHNLHGGYFDLRVLPSLSRALPVVITLHDAWLLSGHCAQALDCDRWKHGCGSCPDLSIYPAVRRDATSGNWRRKRSIYAESRFYIATPSQWLMDRVAQSMLKRAAVDARVIPNGVDLSIFQPADRGAARKILGIPPNAKVLLFAANGVRHNPWKDYQTLRTVVAQVADRLATNDVFFVALGDGGPPEQVGRAHIRFVPFELDRARVALYYSAADLYLHAARAESWGLTITEALACGTPVVATAVGGIPEQIKGLEEGGDDQCQESSELNIFGPEEATGILVLPGDVTRFTAAIVRLLEDEPLRHRLGENAARDARARFGLDRQVEAYLSWYKEIIQRHRAESPRDGLTNETRGVDALPNVS